MPNQSPPNPLQCGRARISLAHRGAHRGSVHAGLDGATILPLGARKLGALARHKSFGMTILILAVLRLLWRLFNRPPELPAGMTAIEKTLARATHLLFYVLLFAMPLTGWMMSSAKNYSVSWFDQFTWPNLIGPNEQAFDLLRSTHDTSELAAIRARAAAHSRGAQTSLLEQG